MQTIFIATQGYITHTRASIDTTTTAMPETSTRPATTTASKDDLTFRLLRSKFIVG